MIPVGQVPKILVQNADCGFKTNVDSWFKKFGLA